MSEKPELRFYYKKLDGTEWYNLKTPDYEGVEGYVTITKEEFEAHLADIGF